MCVLIAELIMLVGGLIALITGKIKLTNSVRLEGWQARVAGLILMSPLPIAFVIGLIWGALVAAGILSPDSVVITSLIEILLVLGALVVAAVFGYLAKPKAQSAATEDGMLRIE